MIELYKILSHKYEDVSNFLRTRDDSTTKGHPSGIRHIGDLMSENIHLLNKNCWNLEQLRIFSFQFVVCPFVVFLLVIVVSVLLYTDSDYLFGIFKLFLPPAVVTTPAIRSWSLEGRLDKFWENQPWKYDYNQTIVINMTGHNQNMTSSDEIETYM